MNLLEKANGAVDGGFRRGHVRDGKEQRLKDAVLNHCRASENDLSLHALLLLGLWMFFGLLEAFCVNGPCLLRSQ